MGLTEALEMVGMTDVGKVREHNEDRIGASVKRGLAVVADGMGGYNAGEIASAMAVKKVATVVAKGLKDLVPGQTDPATGHRYESLVLRDAVEQANEKIYRSAREKDQYRGMGTTVVCALFFDNRIAVAHVGDSRLYRFREAELQQMTSDHSVIQEMLDGPGTATTEEIRGVVEGNIVTHALGVKREVDIDITEHAAQQGDIYLLCTDGLSNMVDDPKIQEILGKKGDDLHDAAKRLVQQANRGGGKDNISVILARVREEFPIDDSWQSKMVEWFND